MNNIKCTQITGQESARQKEDSKLYYNHYNFGNSSFFNINKTDANYKYINDEYRVLLITRAGAEGVDTINSQFNDALSNQIIARAVRFKSHHGLATKERYVNVTRLFLSLKTEASYKGYYRQNNRLYCFL